MKKGEINLIDYIFIFKLLVFIYLLKYENRKVFRRLVYIFSIFD